MEEDDTGLPNNGKCDGEDLNQCPTVPSPMTSLGLSEVLGRKFEKDIVLNLKVESDDGKMDVCDLSVKTERCLPPVEEVKCDQMVPVCNGNDRTVKKEEIGESFAFQMDDMDEKQPEKEETKHNQQLDKLVEDDEDNEPEDEEEQNSEGDEKEEENDNEDDQVADSDESMKDESEGEERSDSDDSDQEDDSDSEEEEEDESVQEEGNEMSKVRKRKHSRDKTLSGEHEEMKDAHKKKERRGKKRKKKEKKGWMRKNIRKLIKETELDEETLAAQKEERERQRRLLEAKRKSFGPDIMVTIKEEPSQDEIPEVDLGDSVKKKKKGDVIEIGSSDEEGEDEIQLVSEINTSTEEEEDYGNSGAHVNDAFNQPDEFGRVIVNVGHPDGDPDIFLAPQIARAVKPHQIGGIRFLYDNIVESLDRYSDSNGFGCILAHSMGLGKTLQVVAFCDILHRHTPARTVLIIVPINTVQNWLSEFNYWLPEVASQSIHSLDGEVRPRPFNIHVLNDLHKTLFSRAKVILEWKSLGGVLLMGYEMYRHLVSRKALHTGKRKKKNLGFLPTDIEEEARNRQLLEEVICALNKPGPDLVVCDEGHRIKNIHASISQSLKSIRTRRRMVLTGYPLQNNLLEYWCMVDFVRPNYLGTKTEFSNMFERPIQNGQCVDSTPSDVRLMRYRAHVLHSLVQGFVQRRGHDVLQSHLPQKEEWVLLIRMTPLQRKLYQAFLMDLEDSGTMTNPIRAFSVCCKIWNHTDILYNFLCKKEKGEDPDMEELGMDFSKTRNEQPTSSGDSASNNNQVASPRMSQDEKSQSTSLVSFRDKGDAQINYDWAIPIFRGYSSGLIESSYKMEIAFYIIEKSLEMGDRVLLFSQSLLTLNLIEDFLHRRTVPKLSEKWTRNINYFRLDGSTAALEREKLINEFNNNSNIHLFLVSTRAGSLGINLVGANRVIVFDASWNPCHDTQAVCRIYRYGQMKPCFIYRLVTDNCLERKMYDRQVSKQGVADRVVDELNPDNVLWTRDSTNLLSLDDTEPPEKDFAPQADDFADQVLKCVLKTHGAHLTKEPFAHESLLIDRKDKKLSEAEKRLAKRSYELEKQQATMRAPYGSYSYGNAPYMPRIAGGNVFMNPRGFQPSFMNRGPFPYGKQVGNALPMQTELLNKVTSSPLLARQGLTMQQLTIPKDVMIPTTTGDGAPIRLRAGQAVTVIRSMKGIFLRLQDGKLVAIKLPPGAQTPGLNRVSTASNGPAEVINLDDSDEDGEKAKMTPLEPTVSESGSNLTLTGLLESQKQTISGPSAESSHSSSSNGMPTNAMEYLHDALSKPASAFRKPDQEADLSQELQDLLKTPPNSVTYQRPAGQGTLTITPVTTSDAFKGRNTSVSLGPRAQMANSATVRRGVQWQGASSNRGPYIGRALPSQRPMVRTAQVQALRPSLPTSVRMGVPITRGRPPTPSRGPSPLPSRLPFASGIPKRGSSHGMPQAHRGGAVHGARGLNRNSSTNAFPSHTGPEYQSGFNRTPLPFSSGSTQSRGAFNSGVSRHNSISLPMGRSTTMSQHGGHAQSIPRSSPASPLTVGKASSLPMTAFQDSLAKDSLNAKKSSDNAGIIGKTTMQKFPGQQGTPMAWMQEEPQKVIETNKTEPQLPFSLPGLREDLVIRPSESQQARKTIPEKQDEASLHRSMSMPAHLSALGTTDAPLPEVDFDVDSFLRQASNADEGQPRSEATASKTSEPHRKGSVLDVQQKSADFRMKEVEPKTAANPPLLPSGMDKIQPMVGDHQSERPGPYPLPPFPMWGAGPSLSAFDWTPFSQAGSWNANWTQPPPPPLPPPPYALPCYPVSMQQDYLNTGYPAMNNSWNQGFSWNDHGT